MQEQLQHASKLKSLGQLTGGVAHDFNNMLTVVIGNLDMAIHRLGEDDPNTKLLIMAKRAAENGANLTHRLLAFARKQSLQMQSVDLQNLIEGMQALLQSTLGETIKVEIEKTGISLFTETDITQFENAIVNLAINARDAMPGGGCLSIKLDTQLLGDDFVSGHDEFSPGRYIRLSVSDTGTGMPDEIRAQAFDPFYTTKGVGQGTGLGLSIVYGFLKQCKGHASISSSPGEGTVVTLYFPLQQENNSAESTAPSNDYPEGNNELVLVLEDNEMVRELVVHLLHQLRYRTLEAASGKEALALLDRESTIDLLFSDVILPDGMSGLEVAEKAWISFPNLKVLFTSGFMQDSKLRSWSVGEHLLLQKPYNKTQLARSVNQVLNQTDN